MHQLTKQPGNPHFQLVGESPINRFNFGVNDYWIWWNQDPNQSGICAGAAYPGGYGSDAAEEIEKKVHLRKPIPNGNYSYVNLQTLTAVPWDFPFANPPMPNFYSSYLFDNWSNLPNYHFCLNPDEMNFYLNGAERIIYNSAPSGLKPIGKSFVSVNMIGTMIIDNNLTELLHIAEVTYGTLIINPNPPEDL